MRKISFKEKKKLKKVQVIKTLYKDNRQIMKEKIKQPFLIRQQKLMKNNYTYKLLSYYKQFNEELSIMLNENKIFIQKKISFAGAIASFNLFGFINILPNFEKAANDDNSAMIPYLEKIFNCNFKDCNFEVKQFMIGTFAIFHELGHLKHFERLASKRNISMDKLIHNLFRIKKRDDKKIIKIEKESLLSIEEKQKLKFELYVNSIFEKAANQYSTKIIQNFIKDGIINLKCI